MRWEKQKSWFKIYWCTQKKCDFVRHYEFKEFNVICRFLKRQRFFKTMKSSYNCGYGVIVYPVIVLDIVLYISRVVPYKISMVFTSIGAFMIGHQYILQWNQDLEIDWLYSLSVFSCLWLVLLVVDNQSVLILIVCLFRFLCPFVALSL